MTVDDDRVAVFHRLHAAGCFVMPNPWDVGSARALEQMGFPALATTSAGLAWTLGRADTQVRLDDLVTTTERFTRHGDMLTYVISIKDPVSGEAFEATGTSPKVVYKSQHYLFATAVTKEAFEIYEGHLKPDGAILVNISNRYLDLRPVVEGLAADAGMACVFMEDADFPEEDAAAGRAPSRCRVRSVSASCQPVMPGMDTSLMTTLNAPPPPEARQFDFWIGHWEVFTPDGRQLLMPCRGCGAATPVIAASSAGKKSRNPGRAPVCIRQSTRRRERPRRRVSKAGLLIRRVRSRTATEEPA